MNHRTLFFILLFLIIQPISAIGQSLERQPEYQPSSDCITIDGRTYKLSPEFRIPSDIDIDSPVKLNFTDDKYRIHRLDQVYQYNGTFGLSVTNSNGKYYLRVHDDNYTVPAEFAQSLAGVDFVLYLDEPQTVPLTPAQLTTLLGTNVLWADTGDVSLTYRADTKAYIEKRIVATRAMLTGIETSMQATKNYTSGDLLIVGDDLYKAIANIANGAALTPGTNVQKVTLAEWVL